MHRPWRTRTGVGSVRQMTDEDGDITLTQSYTPYDEVLYSEGTVTTDHFFIGKRISTSILYIYPMLEGGYSLVQYKATAN
jgi:hypothetical protein